MKTITFFSSLALLFLSLNIQAQQTVNLALDNTIDTAEIIRKNAKKAKTTLRTLAIDYFFNNNPNPDVDGFVNTMTQRMEVVEENSDEVNFFIGIAEDLNSNIDGSNIKTWASEIEGREDYVLINSDLLRAAILNDNVALAKQLNNKIRKDLNTIIKFAKNIKIEAEELKNTPQPTTFYNIRIELVDGQGNPVNASVLPGYVATNQDTGGIYYSGDTQTQAIDEIINLPPGAYRFDAYDGYFDGASSQIITLSNAMVGADGYIVVTLNYWSE